LGSYHQGGTFKPVKILSNKDSKVKKNVEFEVEEKTIVIYRIRHRREAYR